VDAPLDMPFAERVDMMAQSYNKADAKTKTCLAGPRPGQKMIALC
jgi:hypothetical protein